jgi:hypothetical protein
MANDSSPTTQSSANAPAEKPAEKKREIQGGLPYSTAPGTFKKALDALIVAERPDRFTGDFMKTVLKISGGSARPIPPLLKKMNFLSSDGSPTDLYSKFKTDTARGQAALDGLRSAFSEMFRRNEFIHRAEEAEVRDLIVEITGLKKTDPIVRLILQTFEAIRGFADKSSSPSADTVTVGLSPDEEVERSHDRGFQQSLGLSYHINIVLPETDNIAVFNAIFRSLRENLL